MTTSGISRLEVDAEGAADTWDEGGRDCEEEACPDRARFLVLRPAG